MICLGDDSDNEPDSLLRLLDILLSSDRNINEKKQLLENDFQIAMTEHLERGVSEMCNLSKGIEEKGIQKGNGKNDNGSVYRTEDRRSEKTYRARNSFQRSRGKVIVLQ